MAPAVVHLHRLVVKNAKAFKTAWKHAAKLVQKQLPESARPADAVLQPILARNAPKHPLHRIAYLKQSKGRWYTTHSQISAVVRRFTTSAARNSGVKYDKASFPKSHIGSIVNAQAGRAPFASTLRPNLTGGTLGRTAGGYSWGSGRAGGARYFSHGPAAPAQVINNVSQAVRAFLVGGNKAQFDGINSHNGEKRFKTVSALRDQVNRTLNKAPKASPGSYISFNINPTVTALTPLKAAKGFTSFTQEKETLNTAGLLDVLSVDFSRAVKELAAVLNDIQLLATLGDLPISYKNSVLKVHFPGCDAQTVETICDDLGVSRGTVQEDEEFSSFVGSDIALLFPFAPSQTPSECSFYEKPVAGRQHVQPSIDWANMLSPSMTESEGFATPSERSYDQLDDFMVEQNPWLSVSSPSGYDSLHTSEADEMDMETPMEYQGVDGMMARQGDDEQESASMTMDTGVSTRFGKEEGVREESGIGMLEKEKGGGEVAHESEMHGIPRREDGLMEQESPERTPVNPTVEEKKVDVPPNGGYGWVCVAAVATINGHTWGLNSTYAVFLAYYLANDIFPGATPLQYAFIGGLSISQALIVSPIATLTTRRFGTRTTLFIGVAFETVSFIGASFATQIWHLFLSQGICFGWGMGFLFVGSIGIAAQWFTTHRSLANGCCAAGSGLGGLVYSLSAQAMIRNIGLPWAFRILAVIAFVANTASSLFIRDRNKQIGSSQLGFDYRLFRKPQFLGLLAFGFFSMLGYVVLLFSLPNYAKTIGLTAQQGSIIGAVLNLGQALGRPPIGYFSDSIGRLNMATTMTFFGGLFCLVIWMFAKSFGVLIFFSLVGGMVAVSEAIGLEIVAFNGGSYTGAILFTGWMYIGAAVFLWLVRTWKIGEDEENEALAEKQVDESAAVSGKTFEEDGLMNGKRQMAHVAQASSMLRIILPPPPRSISPSLPPPSSPPSASQYFGEATPPPEAREPSSPTWTAPSPARTLGHSSPELPLLPSFSILGNNPRTPSNAARRERTDTSYYTASWGSPYRHPPPTFDPGRQVSANFGSDDFEEESSGLQFGLGHLLPSRLDLAEESPNRFNLEHLIPTLERNASPNRFTLEHLIRSRLPNLDSPTREERASGSTPRPSDSNPTSEEWVQRFLEQRWNRETNDWRSNDSDTEGSVKDQNISLAPPPKRGHRERHTNKTLNQQDFWRHFSKDQKEAFGKMMASKYAEPEVPQRQMSGPGPSATQQTNGYSASNDKTPTPTPSKAAKPVDETPSRPVNNDAAKLNKEASSRPAADTPASSFLAPPGAAPAHPPRMRKKVIVKGKGCIISIPRDIPRGNPGYPPKPMSEEAVNMKLRNLEQQGYDIRGFSTGGLETHNRAIWPSESDMQAERADAGSRFRVRVSKESEWKDYQNSLLEAKLAALGVSMGGEEDIPLPLSRQASSQQHPGTVFSPPLPTSSAGSARMARQGSIVTGGFPFGPSPGHMSRQSVASPAAFANPRTSMHMHRHSTFGSPANFAQHGYSPSGTWSPSGYFNSQDGRTGSPALALSRPDLAGLISPHSPFGMRPNQQFPITQTQRDDFQLQMQMQQQQLQAQLLQQQQQQQQQQVLGMRPSSTLAEVPEDEDEEDEVPAMKHATQSTTEIAVPTPRGHRHNISENLEREAANEEYHLEEAIDKQFAEGGDFSTEPETNVPLKLSNAVANPKWEDSRTILHQPQPHSRAHSLAQSQKPVSFSFPSQQNPASDSDGARTNLSENTNPSLDEGEVRNATQTSAQHSNAPSQVSNSWKDNKFAFSKPASAVHSKHASRSSISKLNVEAKEFKFNPAASFSPGSFSSGFNFAPAVKPPAEPVAAQNSKPSVDGLSNFNVSAPAFKPDAPTFKPDVPAFKPVVEARPANPATNSSNFPSGGFNFSSPPSFKPDAPAFNPGVSTFNPNKPDPAPTSFSSKIFGDVNISANDIVKPATRSKAVPIIRPDNTRQPTPETEDGREDGEDESGRPMQVDGREKRVRRDRPDGDDVPKFALQPVLPSQPLAEVKEPNAITFDAEIARRVFAEGKENSSRNGKQTKVKSKSPEPLPPQQDTKPFEPISPTGSEEDVDDDTPHASDVPTPTTEDPDPAAKKHGHKSTLSASAKPFEFNPPINSAGYDFGFHVTKPSEVEDPPKTVVPPPRVSSRSPATTYRTSNDASFRTAMESGRHPRYTETESADFDNLGDASFNDIDAVMKHMDEEGSDFGVERDETSWEQSSPQRTPNMFERKELQPTFKMRSDAPSPSPRRGFFPGRNINIPGSATSVQDPFDSERAALPFQSPVRQLNNVDDGHLSDWDDNGLLSEDESKIQTRSGFFDKHVDELMGRLLQDRLGPLEQNLQGIQQALATMSQRPGRGRRSISTSERLDSDADDEDDEVGTEADYRNRSRGKDKRLEKIRSIVKDALEMHQSQITSIPVPVPEPMIPEKIREIVTDALAQHQPSVQPVEPDQIRAIVQDAIASNKPAQNATESLRPEDIRSILADMLASHVPQPVEPVKTDDIRSIVMEAFETHAPQPMPAPVPEQIWPDDLRAIVAEAISTSHTPVPTAPATDAVQPDMIRSIVADALASQRPATLEAPVDIPQPQLDMSELYQIIGSLKASIAQTTSHHLQAEDVRELIDDAFKRQNTEVAKREDSQAVQERDVRIADLEEMLKEATLRFDAEAEARKAIEAREVDSARLLKVTEEELNLLQQASRDDEHKIRALTEERDDLRRSVQNYQSNEEEMRDRLSMLEIEGEQLKLTNIALESSEEDLKKKLDSVTAENEALTYTLEEHRLSANKWRGDLQVAHEEAEQLRKSIGESRYQAEEATRVRESMRSKLEKLQQDMIAASQQVASERAQWQKNEEASSTKYEILSARIEAEGRTRERLERELERLETQEREGMKLRFHLEQTQKHNARLEETVKQLRHESTEHQKNAERFERDMREARDAAHVEIRRTRVLMEADVDAANNQVNIVRHELESEIGRVRAELDQVRLDADTAKEKHELDLEAASDAKKQAVQESIENNRHSLHEQQRTFERQLEHIKREHARALDFAREDRERAEAFHNDKLALADSKLDHFKDKISLLEEKLQVAKEAANAAIAAASKSPTPTSSFAPSGAEKISPQALRESIGVLQEQLQEREGRIESLERQLEEVDTEAPTKLKERDTEINWLRELLGVRVDDLNDLINSLAQPTFDRETVRDAAIRIRTNLQMEQSEKERLISGGQQSFPTLSSLSNFASPKAVQLAAAIGNWRKGRGEAASALAGNASSASRNQTPSRTQPHSAQSFLSGLMTPPTSNMRRTPDAPSSSQRPQAMRSNSSSSRASTEAGFPALGKQPRTPPLMRKQAYDQDADIEPWSESGFYDDESAVDDGQLTPLALNFGRELRQ
ncbi:hypothetical protein DDE83_005038 [Stemphylium lycopersici]|uniref:MFS general substrate transporter n=1 Tax=Stemphylium lycopersici TaxID=183478 RepID=A0A364N3E8_STELY|nr:hypothetical protein DDE83_005038 [Stemphylium lycopersici]